MGEIQGQVVQKPSFNCRCFGSKLEDKDVAHGNYGNHGNHKNDERCVATHPIGLVGAWLVWVRTGKGRINHTEDTL